MNEYPHYSYSQLNMYGGCSRKWHFQYTQNIPYTTVPAALVLGTAMHDVIQSHVTMPELPDPAARVHDFESAFRTALSRYPDTATYDRQEMGDALIKGRDMLTNDFAHTHMRQLHDAGITETERRFEIVLPGISKPIIGYIDMIDADGIPYDIKTAGRMWSKNDFETDIQSTLYVMALHELGLIDLPATFRFLIITKTKSPRWVIYDVQRDIDDILRLKNWIWEIDQHILAGVHKADPRPNWMCNYCDYWPICQGGLIRPTE